LKTKADADKEVRQPARQPAFSETKGFRVGAPTLAHLNLLHCSCLRRMIFKPGQEQKRQLEELLIKTCPFTGQADNLFGLRRISGRRREEREKVQIGEIRLIEETTAAITNPTNHERERERLRRSQHHLISNYLRVYTSC